MFEAYPEAVSQERDHDMALEPLGAKVPDRANGQVAFKGAENSFGFGQLHILSPKLGRIAALQVGP